MTDHRARALIALFALTSVAAAQCPEWTAEFSQPAIGGTVLAAVVLDDGAGPTLCVGGAFASAGGVAVANVARWDGHAWSGLGAGLDGAVRSLAAFDDGSGPRLYAGGDFTASGSTPLARIARFDGVAWQPLASGLDGPVHALHVHDLGAGASLYAGGTFANSGALTVSGIARWTGAAFEPLGLGVAGVPGGTGVWCLASHASSLVAGGTFTSAGGVQSGSVARWDGTAWSAFGTQALGRVQALATHDDGSGPALYAGGSLGVPSAPRVARWNGAQWTQVGTTLAAPSTGEVRALRSRGTELFVTGTGLKPSSDANGTSVKRWNGLDWAEFDIPPRGSIHATAVFAPRNDPLVWFLGSEGATGLAMYFGGDRLGSLGAGMHSYWIELPTSTALYDDGSGTALYATGNFRMPGAFRPSPIARWDGYGWTPVPVPQNLYLGAGLGLSPVTVGTERLLMVAGVDEYIHPFPRVAFWNGQSWSQALTTWADDPLTWNDGGGEKVCASISYYGSPTDSGVSTWDGVAWSQLGSTLQYAEQLCVHDGGMGASLYLAAHSQGVKRWTGTAWESICSAPSTGSSGPRFRDLASSESPSGRRLLAAFEPPGSYPGGLAWCDGPAPVAFAPAPPFEQALALAAFDDGSGHGTELFVFARLSSAPATFGLAAWNGANWRSPAGTFSGPLGEYSYLFSLRAHAEPDGRRSLVATAEFTAADGRPNIGIARWSACEALGRVVCAGDGSAAACPCGNESPPLSGAGCLHSLQRGGMLRARGAASVGVDTLVLDATELANGACLFFQGTSTIGAGAGSAFGDGLRCAGGTLIRLATRATNGGVASYPDGVAPPISTAGGIGPVGGARTYQVWFRNAASFCTPATFNLTNGLSVTWWS